MGTTALYEEVTDEFCSDTGEITHQKSTKVRKLNVEPTDEYVKVSRYLNVIYAYMGIPLNLVPISLIFAQRMQWRTNKLYLLKQDKIEISEMLGYGCKDKSTNTVDKLIAQCKKYDIIRPLKGYRGVYEVNSFLFSTGDTANTRDLQTHFDFDTDTIVTVAEMKNRINGEVVRKSVTNKDVNRNQITDKSKEVSEHE